MYEINELKVFFAAIYLRLLKISIRKLIMFYKITLEDEQIRVCCRPHHLQLVLLTQVDLFLDGKLKNRFINLRKFHIFVISCKINQ